MKRALKYFSDSRTLIITVLCKFCSLFLSEFTNKGRSLQKMQFCPDYEENMSICYLPESPFSNSPIRENGQVFSLV